jgi:predicted Zn-dependent peptidase
VSEPIQVHAFPNGLVLIAEPMASLESAAFSFLIPGGCVYEIAGQHGLATVTCDLTLRGCGTRDNRQFIEELESLGVERGDSVSAGHISYSGATIAKNLPAALGIYADVLRRPLLPKEHLEAAKQLVLQEIRAIEDEPAQKVMLELRKRHYGEPWGRSSHGDARGVGSVKLADVKAYHQKQYSPRGTILAVAGKINWPSLKEEVGRLFADWTSNPSSPVAPQVDFPHQEHVLHDSNQTQIGIAYESVPYRHEDYFQAAGAIGILSGGMSSRLFTEVREKRGLCYSVYATSHTTHDRGSVLCYAGTSAERAQETLDVTLGELERIVQGVHEDELQRLKARIKSGLIMQQESSISRSSAIARDYYHLGKVRTLTEIGRLVDGLSCESINGFLRRCPPKNFTVVTLGPQPLKMPHGI